MLPAEAKRHQYLMVKGLLGDEMFGYLEDNQQRLERRGLDTREVQVDTEASLADNIEVVRKALEDAAFYKRSVVLVGHSKGAVESRVHAGAVPGAAPGRCARWWPSRRRMAARPSRMT